MFIEPQEATEIYSHS